MSDTEDIDLAMEKEIANMEGGKSVITDLKAERRRVALVTFAVLSGAASYIIMLFIAMPISIHLIVNINSEEGCNVQNADEACFAPSSDSQSQLTLTLTLLRAMTFLFGSLVGTLSDRYGRRPMLILALSGYATTAVCFLIGWETQSLELFLLGAIILGASSPITPHGIAYVSDISMPNRLAPNLGILQGIGYFIGLMTGAMISLAISALTNNADDVDLEVDGILPYNQLFYASYSAGLIFTASSALSMLFFLPESLHKDERTEEISIAKANPLGFLYMVTRNPYIFFIWLSAFFAWMAVGAGESVTGGWWLRRYAMTEVNDFITYTVLLWVSSGIGSVVMTKVYIGLMGLKGSVHISAIFTLLVGVAFAFAPTVPTSYIAVGLSFFASAVYPTQLAVLMGQVGPREKGALAGAIRSSEALAKLIGITVFGNTFAAYIEEFTPDGSCVPDTYNGASNKENTCECGVESCPVIGETGPVFVPSPCTLGQLSQTFHGKPSLSVEFDTTVESGGDNQPGLGILPDALISAGLVERSDECLGGGLVPSSTGFTSSINRVWCADDTGPPAGIGCLGSDFLGNSELGIPAGGGGVFFACLGAFATDPPNAIATCNALVSTQNTTGIDGLPTSTEAVLEQLSIISAGETLDVCGEVQVNVCLLGPITEFPGLFPLLYLSGLGAISYFFFIIAEMCFVSRDAKYWKEVEDEEINEAHNVGTTTVPE